MSENTCVDCNEPCGEYKRCYQCKLKADEKYAKQAKKEPVQTKIEDVFEDRKTLMFECYEAVKEMSGKIDEKTAPWVSTLFIEICRSRRN